MSSIQIAPPMTNPPTSCATEPTDARFFSPYPHYFSFDNHGTTSIEQGRPDNLATSRHMYAENNLVDVGGPFASQEAMKGMNDFVPLGTQVAWDQGATTSEAMDHSMRMTSPMSQSMSMPLIPGISSFGPILNTWPMPPVQRRRPSGVKPMPGQQASKKRKQPASEQKTQGDNKKTASTADTNIPQASSEDEAFSPKDTTMTDSHDDDQAQASKTTMMQDEFDNSSIMIGYSQTQPEDSPPPPSQGNPSGSRLATQRARNRVAANKFRKKSKAAVAELEAVERGLSAQHEHLSTMVRDLREEVLGLKNELLLHGNCDCAMIHQYLSNTARSLSLGCPTPMNNKAGQGDLPSVTPSSDESSSVSK